MSLKKYEFFLGITILIFLAISYFIKIDMDYGSNYNVKDRLLGIIIFHNPFILAIYVLVGVYFIVKFLITKSEEKNKKKRI